MSGNDAAAETHAADTEAAPADVAQTAEGDPGGPPSAVAPGAVEAEQLEAGPVETAEPGAAGDDASPSQADGPAARYAPEPMAQMLFVDVALVLPSTHPVVVLQEADWPYRELRIPVGGAEGVAIGYAARRVATPRPLTHEMISRLLDSFELTLDQVRITSLAGSNFVGELVVSGRLGVRTIDCRPSDAIALALRRSIPVPIMVSPDVLELVGGGAASAN